MICDTRETIQYEESLYQPGEYQHSFYPLVEVLRKWKAAGWSGLSEDTLNRYMVEDEYIMRINSGNMYNLKWV